jgi:6-phosphofructokinase 1
LCLVPEVDFYLDGPGGVVDHLAERLLKNGKAVVVVAEGAGQNNIEEDMAEKGETKTDASGNVLLEDVGPWLTKKLKQKLDEKLEGKTEHGDKVYPKYIDPSYMVRGVPPNTADNVYCTQLAHNAVHGAFAGFTSFVVGSVNTRECYVPSRILVNKRNVIDTDHQSLWEYVVFDTGQPSFQKMGDKVYDKAVTISASGGVVLELS